MPSLAGFYSIFPFIEILEVFLVHHQGKSWGLNDLKLKEMGTETEGSRHLVGEGDLWAGRRGAGLPAAQGLGLEQPAMHSGSFLPGTFLAFPPGR